MTYSEQLERDAERERAEIEETLDELRARLRPGNLVDQLVDYARDGAGAQFYENLKRQVVDNPLPVTMIGAGLAWLAISNGMSHRRRAEGNGHGDGYWSESGDSSNRLHRAEDGLRRFGDGVSSTAHEAADGIGDRYRSATESARRGAESLRERAASTSDAISDRAGAMYRRAGDVASQATDTMSDSMERARRSISDTSQALADFSREQPLVVAAIGVAIGAAIGSALPSTEAEARVMGETADNAKARARDLVDEQKGRVKSAAEDIAATALDKAKETSTAAMDAMDRQSEPNSGNDFQTSQFGEGEEQRRDARDQSAEDQSAEDQSAEEKFTAGDRPSNG